MWLYRNILAGFLLVAAGVLLLGGCGYQFRDQQSQLPPRIESLAVPIFENKTNELGLEYTMTANVIREFNRRHKIPIENPQYADAILYGTITSIYYSALSYGSDNRTNERRVNLTVDVRAVERTTGEILWVRNSLYFQEGYPVDQTKPNVTQYSKEQALDLITQNIAEKIHDLMFSAF